MAIRINVGRSYWAGSARRESDRASDLEVEHVDFGYATCGSKKQRFANSIDNQYAGPAGAREGAPRQE